MHIVKNNLLKFHTFHLDMPILILILMLSFIKSVLCYTENQDTLEIDKNVEISTEKVKEYNDEKPKKRKIDVDDKSDFQVKKLILLLQISLVLAILMLL